MKKYRTRAGNEVNIWTFDSHQVDYPIRGEVLAADGVWEPATWAVNFSYIGCKEPSPNDLVEVHPCDGLKPGDKVRVWSEPGRGPHNRTFLQSFVGITAEGRIDSQAFGINNAVIETWHFGEPA